MTLFFLIAMTALLVIYLVRVVQLEGNSPNSFVVLPLIAGIIITGSFEYRWFSMESKGSHLVSYISGEPHSELDCQRMIEAFYDFNLTQKAYIDEKDPTTVHMKYEECMELTNWLGSDMATEQATSKQALALHLLIFEAMKVEVKGQIDNATAECKTTARYTEIAQYLGATPHESARMLQMYQTDWYPLLSEDYKSPC